MVMAEDSDMDIGSEDLSTVIVRVGLNEDDQSNVPMPNLGDERKLAQTELKSEYGCPSNC